MPKKSSPNTKAFTAPKRSILLVDDDASLRELYQTRLSLEGFLVTTAASGSEALHYAQTQKPAIIFLDVIMPKMDGFETLQKLKADPRTADIPVCMLTNLGNPKDKQKALDLGAIKYYVKADVTLTQFISCVKKYINLSN